ncbi:unnamed protein product [Urochloa humidicola]
MGPTRQWVSSFFFSAPFSLPVLLCSPPHAFYLLSALSSSLPPTTLSSSPAISSLSPEHTFKLLRRRIRISGRPRWRMSSRSERPRRGISRWRWRRRNSSYRQPRQGIFGRRAAGAARKSEGPWPPCAARGTAASRRGSRRSREPRPACTAAGGARAPRSPCRAERGRTAGLCGGVELLQPRSRRTGSSLPSMAELGWCAQRFVRRRGGAGTPAIRCGGAKELAETDAGFEREEEPANRKSREAPSHP